MTELEELRVKLSDVDDQIVKLYEERMNICEEIGMNKIRNGYKIFDRQRERNKITEVTNKVTSEFNKKGIGEVYKQFLAISRKLQYQQLVDAGALGRLPFIEIRRTQESYFREQKVLTVRLPWSVILEKDVTIIMYIRFVRRWKQLKRELLTMRYFRSRIPRQERLTRFMICW